MAGLLNVNVFVAASYSINDGKAEIIDIVAVDGFVADNV